MKEKQALILVTERCKVSQKIPEIFENMSMTYSIGECIIERMKDMKYMDSLIVARALLFPESRSVIRDKMIDRSFSFYMSFYDSPDIGTDTLLIPHSDLPKVIRK